MHTRPASTNTTRHASFRPQPPPPEADFFPSHTHPPDERPPPARRSSYVSLFAAPGSQPRRQPHEHHRAVDPPEGDHPGGDETGRRRHPTIGQAPRNPRHRRCGHSGVTALRLRHWGHLRRPSLHVHALRGQGPAAEQFRGGSSRRHPAHRRRAGGAHRRAPVRSPRSAAQHHHAGDPLPPGRPGHRPRPQCVGDVRLPRHPGIRGRRRQRHRPGLPGRNGAQARTRIDRRHRPDDDRHRPTARLRHERGDQQGAGRPRDQRRLHARAELRGDDGPAVLRQHLATADLEGGSARSRRISSVPQ